MSKTISMKDSNYRWVIFGVSFLIFFALIGVASAPFSLYIVPVTEYFGFSRGDFTLIFTIKTVIGVIIQLSFGPIIKQLGLRWVVVLGSVVMPIGFFIFAGATSLWMFYLGGFFVGVGFSLASITPVTLLIDQWFDKGEGLILGVISAGSGFGGALFSRIIGVQIVERGFQSAFQFTAFFLVVTVIPVILFIRSKPDGKKDKGEPLPGTGVHMTNERSNRPLDLGEIFKQGHFLLALAAVFLIGMTMLPVIFSTPPYLIEKGFDGMFAASIAGVIFLFMAFAKIMIGFMYDRLGIRTSLLIGIGSFVTSTLILVLSAQQWMVWIFALFGGIGASTLAVLTPLYARKILGKQNYRQYLGMFIAVLSAGIGIGTPLINYVYDLSGSYTMMIAINGIVAVLALILAFFALNRKQADQVSLSEPA